MSGIDGHLGWTGEHPDDALLADLSVDALPVERSAEVRQHVAGCPRCGARLAAAERMSGLLRADEPGRMPADVVVRIETALATAVRQERDARQPAAPADPRRLRAAGGGLPRPVTRLRRRGHAAAAGQRPDRRPDPLIGRVARIAATVAVVGAIGSVAWLSGVGRSGTSTGAAGSAASSAAAAAPVLATGTDYAGPTLAEQARTLVAAVRRQPMSAESRSMDSSATAAGAGPQVATGTTGDQSLRTPAALQACLSGLDTGGRQPAVVDLARYQGRDAAVVVVPAGNGGYDVYVVPRACGRGAIGKLAYTVVPAP